MLFSENERYDSFKYKNTVVHPSVAAFVFFRFPRTVLVLTTKGAVARKRRPRHIQICRNTVIYLSVVAFVSMLSFLIKGIYNEAPLLGNKSHGTF